MLEFIHFILLYWICRIRVQYSFVGSMLNLKAKLSRKLHDNYSNNQFYYNFEYISKQTQNTTENKVFALINHLRCMLYTYVKSRYNICLWEFSHQKRLAARHTSHHYSMFNIPFRYSNIKFPFRNIPSTFLALIIR